MATITQDVNINFNDGGANKSIDELKAKLNEIVNTANLEIKFDSSEAETSISNLRNQLYSLLEQPLNLDVSIDSGGLSEVKEEIDSLGDKSVNVDVTVNGNEVQDIKEDIDNFEDKTIDLNVEVNGESIPDLKEDLDSIAEEPVNIQVEVEGNSIPEIKEEIDSIKDNTIRLNVNTDKSVIDELINNIGNVEAQIETLDGKEIDVKVQDNTQEVIENLGEIDNDLQEITTLDQRIDLIVDNTESISSVTELKKQIKELENIALQAGDSNSAAYLKATQAAGRLSDRLGDIKDATKTFTAGDPVEGLSKGFGNLKNKLTDLDFGGFIEETQRLSALSGQLSFKSFSKSIGDVGKGFVNLGKVLLTNPLFLLAAAVGLIIANFDRLLALIDGVSSAQQDNLDIAKKQVTAEQEKLDAISVQENTLRLQGKSEKQILNLKIAQTEEVIAASQIALEQQQNLVASQVEASERNKDILKGILDFVSIPLTLLLETIDRVGNAFGQSFNLREQFKESVATLIFDPKAVEEEGNKAIKEQEKALAQLISQRDGYKLQIQDIDKKAGDERIAQTKEETDAILEIERLLEEKRLSSQAKQLAELDNFYADRRQKLEESFKGDTANETAFQNAQKQLDTQYYADRLKIIDDFTKSAEEKQQELNDFLQQNGVQSQADERALELQSIAQKYATEIELARKNKEEQIELERILIEERKNLVEQNAPQSDIDNLDIQIADQIARTSQATQIILDLETQRGEKIMEKRQEYADEDKRLDLEVRLAKIQNESAVIQSSFANSDIKIQLLQDEYDAARLLREQDQADAIEKAAGNAQEIEKINEDFRAQDLAATQEFLQSKSEVFEQELQKNMAAAEGVANALNQIGDSAGGVFGGVNTLVGNLTTGFVGLKGSFADLKTNLADIDAQVEAGAITAEEGAKARFEAFGAAVSATLSVVSDAVNQVGQILADQSQQRIDDINNVRDTQLNASQEETDSQIADLEKQKQKGLVTEAQYQAALDKINETAKSKEDKINQAANKKELAAKKKAFNQNKAVQITNAAIATAQGVISAFQLGPIAGAIAAALVGAIGVAQIAVISSKKFPEEGGSGGGGGSSPSLPDIGGASSGNGPSPFEAPQFFDIGQSQPNQPPQTQPIIVQNNIVETDITRVQNEVNVIETRATIT